MNDCFTRCYILFLIGFFGCVVGVPQKIGYAQTSVPTPTSKPAPTVVFDQPKIESTPQPTSKPKPEVTSVVKDVSRQQIVQPIVNKVETIASSHLVRRKPDTVARMRAMTERDSRLYSNALSKQQASLYRQIFDLQKIGQMGKADVKIKDLQNDLLMGHVLAQRYLHPTGYRSNVAELKSWLANYGDHPQAYKIYKLAEIKGAQDVSKPKKLRPIRGNLGMSSIQTRSYKSTKDRSAEEQADVIELFRTIKHHIKQYEPTQALELLKTSPSSQFLDNVEYDQLRAIIASGYLYAGKLEQASELSSQALNRSGSQAPYAGWVQGLVQWQYKNFANAARAFESAATSSYSSGWMISASAYWASRSNMRAGNSSLVSKWLELSASYPRTFYGLISTRALGNDLKFNWDMPSLSSTHVEIIESTKLGKRASALIQVRQKGLAEQELQYFDHKGSIANQQALLAYANYNRLPALSMRLGNAFSNPNGGIYDAALFPMAAWEPRGGFKVDKALIMAIIRQESRFQYLAQNPTGATGLMQLMPTTANYISGKSIYETAAGQYQLIDPSVNLEIGQKYVQHLLKHPAVRNDLLSMTIAYNAGPGTLTRWKRERKQIDDPLLFIETIPYNETRAFIERVLSNYWIYQMRLNQSTPSLDAVAEGRWARYAAQDTELFEVLAQVHQ